MKKEANVAELLRTHKNEIIERWEARVVQELPFVCDISGSAIRNGVPDFIDELCASLKNGNFRSQRLFNYALQHGAQRSTFESYNVRAIIVEYRFLREVLTKVIVESGDLSQKEINEIRNAVDIAVEQAANQFVESRERTLQEDATTNAALKEHFVAAISHDLRNPIGTARMAAELLKDKPGPATEAEVFEILFRNLSAAEELIENFLDVNRLKAGQPLPLTFRTVNVSDSLEIYVLEYRRRFSRTVTLDCEPRLHGEWDPRALKRILENLIDNADKFSPKGEPVGVKAFRKENFIGISIHNRGEPIPKNALGKIFDYQFSGGNRARKKEGWGIGLAVVKGLVDAHSGRLEVESNEELGTTFTIWLPINPTSH